MVSTAGCNHKGPSLSPGRVEHTQAYHYWYCECLLWTNDGKDRRPICSFSSVEC